MMPTNAWSMLASHYCKSSDRAGEMKWYSCRCSLTELNFLYSLHQMLLDSGICAFKVLACNSMSKWLRVVRFYWQSFSDVSNSAEKFFLCVKIVNFWHFFLQMPEKSPCDSLAHFPQRCIFFWVMMSGWPVLRWAAVRAYTCKNIQ